MAPLALPLIAAASVGSAVQGVRESKKAKKRASASEQAQQKAISAAEAEQRRQDELASQAPATEARQSRRRIGLRSLRVDPGLGFGGGATAATGVGGGLRI